MKINCSVTSEIGDRQMKRKEENDSFLLATKEIFSRAIKGIVDLVHEQET